MYVIWCKDHHAVSSKQTSASHEVGMIWQTDNHAAISTPLIFKKQSRNGCGSRNKIEQQVPFT